MTRKDYIALAEIIRTHPYSPGLASALAAWLVEDNPRFDKVRFMRACALDDSTLEGLSEAGTLYPIVDEKYGVIAWGNTEEQADRIVAALGKGGGVNPRLL